MPRTGVFGHMPTRDRDQRQEMKEPTGESSQQHTACKGRGTHRAREVVGLPRTMHSAFLEKANRLLPTKQKGPVGKWIPEGHMCLGGITRSL